MKTFLENSTQLKGLRRNRTHESPLTFKGTESVVHNLPLKETPAPSGFTGELHKTSKRLKVTIFQVTGKGNTPHLVRNTTITLTP